MVINMAKEKEKKELNIFESGLVPQHEVVSGDEKTLLLEQLNITTKQLPKIKEDDPAVKALDAKKGDVLKITRASPTAGEYYYYRFVV